VRTDQILDLAAGRPSLESPHDFPVLDKHERWKHRDLQLVREPRALIDIELDDAQPSLLGDFDPSDQAFHAPRGAGLPLSQKEESRQLGGELDGVGQALGAHLQGVPPVDVLETARKPAFHPSAPREHQRHKRNKEDRMSGKTVRDAMTASPTSIASDKTVVDAARTMTTENVGSLPVVEEQKLVGMITDRDLVTNVLAKDLDPNKVPVAEVATQDPVSVSPDESLETALERMAEQQVRRLPVVEDGLLVGILAQADVSRTAGAESTGRMVEKISES